VKTLDEAIDHYEKLAAEYEFKIMSNDDFNFSQPKWREAAAECRQMAEWLKDYKKLKALSKVYKPKMRISEVIIDEETLK
jgi:hypothetical protein